MTSYGISREHNHANAPISCHKFVHNHEDENSEIEFEGWLQLGNKSMEHNNSNKCPRSQSIYVTTKPQYISEHTNCCCHQSDYVQIINDSPNYNRSNCTNHNQRHINKKCNFKYSRHDDDVLYVNNKQQAPTVLVQKPHTVVVRNKSRPPILVQQPPPNVIVKNDPPQPVYIQNYPPNVMIKNEDFNQRMMQYPKPQQNTCNCNNTNKHPHNYYTQFKHY